VRAASLAEEELTGAARRRVLAESEKRIARLERKLARC